MTSTVHQLAALTRAAYHDLTAGEPVDGVLAALTARFAEHELDADVAESALDWFEGGSLLDDLADALTRAGNAADN